MQYYEGCEELSLQCAEIFDKLEDQFIQNAKDLARDMEIYVDNSKISENLTEIFRSIIGTRKESQELFELLKKCFPSNEIAAKYILSTCTLLLLNKFILMLKEQKADKIGLCVYLVNAIERFNKIFGINSYTPYDEDDDYMQSNTISFGSQGIQLFGDIFAEFKTLQAQNKTLKMLNLYKGVNIINQAKIVEIKGQSVILQVDLMQILAMRQEGFAYILKSDDFSSNVQAKILNFNIANSSVLLSEFQRSEKTTAIMRKFPRVQPSKVIAVKLFSKDTNMAIDGKLFDISQGGIGVVSSQNGNWKSGQMLRAIFALDINGQEYNIVLDIQLVISLNYQGSMRYCCKINDYNQQCINAIVAFSNIRVRQTIEELRAQANTLI